GSLGGLAGDGFSGSGRVGSALPPRLAGSHGLRPDRRYGTDDSLRLFHAVARPFLFDDRIGRVARHADGNRLLLSRGAAKLGAQRGRALALSAGDALCDSRDAYAALCNPGIERADFEIRAHRGQTETTVFTHQLGVETPGAYGRDFPRCGAAFGW